MSINVVPYNSLQALPKAYDELFSSNATKSFFLSRSWWDNFSNTIINNDNTLFMLGVENENGHPIALLPLKRASKTPVIKAKKVSALTNYYTSYFSPLLSCDLSETSTIMQAFADYFCNTDRQWDYLQLNPLNPDDPYFSALISAFREKRCLVEPYHCYANWHTDITSENFDDYFSQRPSQIRNTYKRKLKKLSREHEYKIRLIIDDTNLDEAIKDYETIYSDSWKVPEPYPEFVHNLIRLCARNGWLRLGILYVDDKPVSMQFWIVSNSVASIYKLAYTEEFKNYSVGTILAVELFKHVIEIDKVTSIDYLTGDDAYKRSWMSKRSERQGLLICNKYRPYGQLMALYTQLGRIKRQMFTS